MRCSKEYIILQYTKGIIISPPSSDGSIFSGVENALALLEDAGWFIFNSSGANCSRDRLFQVIL